MFFFDYDEQSSEEPIIDINSDGEITLNIANYLMPDHLAITQRVLDIKNADAIAEHVLLHKWPYRKMSPLSARDPPESYLG
jgi:hypothetical protein